VALLAIFPVALKQHLRGERNSAEIKAVRMDTLILIIGLIHTWVIPEIVVL
jgi:hypothetical protein